MSNVSKQRLALAAGVVAAGLLALHLRKQRSRQQSDEKEGLQCKLEMMESEPIKGQEKYLGGVLGADGGIYGIPGHAKQGCTLVA